MWSLRRSRPAALALAVVSAGCSSSSEPTAPAQGWQAPTRPSFTAGSGTSSTLLGRATFGHPRDPFRVAREQPGWRIEIKSKPALDLAVQTIDFQPGGQSGWHMHPGPVFIQVVSGTMTFYSSDDPSCTPIVRTQGEGFLDVGDHAHIARNETSAPAQNVVTYFAPVGASLRIDAPSPGNCPF
jgi:hypothetical protein